MNFQLRIATLIFFFLVTFAVGGVAQTSHGSSVSGTVIDERGERAAGVLVCAYGRNSMRNTCVVSRPDGTFDFNSDSRGSSFLVPEKRRADHISPWLPFFRDPSVGLTEVNFGVGESNSDVIVRLPPKNGFLTGKVVDGPTGLPVDNARFQLCHVANPRICHSTDAKSADGNFRMPAPHVSFFAKVTAKGYEIWSSSEGGASMMVRSGDVLDRTIVLRRKPEFMGRAMHESEKREGVHLPAPDQIAPADEAKIDIFPRSTRLEWNSVAEAASYFVEVDICYGGEPAGKGCVNPQTWRVGSVPATPDTSVYSFDFNFVGAQPGRWRVVALDSKGIEGFKSPWSIIFYTR